MAQSKRKKKSRGEYPDLPEALAVPVVDNHTHVNYSDWEVGEEGAPAFPPPMSIEEHVRRMDASGVRHAITSGCEIPEIATTVAIAEEYSSHFSAALGIHPNEAALHAGVTEVAPDGLEFGLKPWHRNFSLDDAITIVYDVVASSPHVVAIGETGLDYFRTADAGKEAQQRAFREHIQMAKELDLPLQIHDREAHQDCYDILMKDGAPERTVFHAFSGDAEFARMCAEQGWYGSFSGQLTFNANSFMREAFMEFPAELILAETDAPYLTAVPWRGHPNAPYAVVYTVRFGAELRNIDTDSWCDQLNANTKNVYGV